LVQLEEKYQKAIEAAIQASKKIIEIYNEGFHAIFKEDGSPLTKADLASTDIISEILTPLNIPITGEETEKMQFNERVNWLESWCVDPLDGTKEFISRNGEFAVNIALIKNEKPIFGVIASPVNQEIIFGGNEIGVYFFEFNNFTNQNKWKQIHVPKQINSPLVMTCSRSHHSGPILEFIDELHLVSEKIEFLKKGSSLKFFDLVFGKADAYPRFAPTMEWDIAAGQAILEALGGIVYDADTKQPLRYNKANLTNPFFIAKTKPLLDILP
jgi:3'(2'), 5'-bisphosphate nucleotidase